MPSGASLERVLDHLLDNFGRTRGGDTGHDPQASMELASNASRSSRDASWRLDWSVLQFNSMGYMPQNERDEKSMRTVRVYLN